MKRGNWTIEEEIFLEEKFGAISIKSIAKNLNRAFEDVRKKAHQLRLGDPKECFDGVTVSQLAVEMDVTNATVVSWITKHGLPSIKKIFVKEKKVSCVNLREFWKWAEEHKRILNFSRLEKYALGAEPDWAQVKRGRDKMNLSLKKKKRLWTADDDLILRSMVNAYSYTYAEIAQRLQRSENAISVRLTVLKLKARPLPARKTSWTPEQENLLLQLFDGGYGLNTIGEKLGRNSIAVRCKMQDMGYRFCNGVPIKKDLKETKVL